MPEVKIIGAAYVLFPFCESILQQAKCIIFFTEFGAGLGDFIKCLDVVRVAIEALLEILKSLDIFGLLKVYGT